MASPLDVLLGAQVKDDGVAVTPRRYIDFRTGLTITDDPATDSIRVSASGGGGGVLVGDANGDADNNVVTRITGDTGDVEMVATSLSWGAPGSSQLKVNAVDGAIELWNNAALALKAHGSASTIANTASITQIVGGVRHTVRTISSNIALDSTTKDFIGWVDASAPRTITLPTPSSGRTFLLVNVGASTITIARSGSEMINGVAANYVVPVANCIVQIVTNGTDWFALPIFDGTGTYVTGSRTIATTAPLTGGGDLSANRTLAISDATTGAVGVVRLTQDLGGSGAAPTVLGLTGTANVVALHGTAILADAGSGGRLNFSSTGLAIPAGDFSVGTQAAKVYSESFGLFGATHSGVWLGAIVPGTDNFAVVGDGTSTIVNALTRVQMAEDGVINATFTSDGLRIGDTSDPTDRLEVVGNMRTSGGWIRASRNNSASTLAVADACLNLETPSGGQGLLVFSFAGSPAGGIRADNVGNFNWHSSAGGYHQFYRGLDTSTPVANLTDAGLAVGFGAGTAATKKLDVNGVGRFVTANTASAMSSANAALMIDNSNGGAGLSHLVFAFAGTAQAGFRAGFEASMYYYAGGSQYHQFLGALDGSVPLASIANTGLLVGGTLGAVASEKLDIVGNAKVSGKASLGTGGTSIHSVVGGVDYTVRFVSSNMTIDTTTKDYLLYVDTTSAPIDITLPAATDGRMLFIKRSAGTNAVNVLISGGVTIDGDTDDIELVTDGGGSQINPYIVLGGDGSGKWNILGHWSIFRIVP